MSTDERPATVDPGPQVVEPWGITREQLTRRERMAAEPTKDNERRCPECNLRVTRTQSGREVGHANGRKYAMCPSHPDSDDEPEQQSLEAKWS